jgi:hypothetical protein
MIALLLLFGFQADGFPKRVEVDNVDAWPNSGRIIVEGVFTSLTEGGESYRVMHLRKPNVPFNVPRSLLREKAPTGNIEVVGVVESPRGKLVVQVEDIKLLPSDEVRFQDKIGAAGDNPDKHFEAAAWAKRRYELYKSEAMAAAERSATKSGFELERKQAKGDPEKLSALKLKLQRRQIVYDYDALDHEMMHAEYARIPADDPAALMSFAEKIKERLPGSKEIGAAVDPRHRIAYDARPLPTYESADTALRQALSRYFYSTVVDKALAAAWTKNREAPFDLAEKAKKLAPEYQEIARKWYRDWAKTQEGRLVDLEGDAAEETAATIEKELQDFPRATRLRSEWLDAREVKLRQREREAAEEAGDSRRTTRDADSWFDLAMRRRKWFKDNPEHEAKVVKLLEEVLSFAPQYSKAEIQLRNLGYTQTTDGRWRRKTDRSMDPRRPADARSLAVNMTTAEVLGAVGKPTHQSRIVTAAGASVVWIYSLGGKETLVVFSGPPDALRVSRIRASRD